MKKHIKCIRFIWLLIFFHTSLIAQESIFSGPHGGMKKADNLYQKQAYPEAIELYVKLLDKNKTDTSLVLKIANAYFLSNEMNMAVQWYDKYHELGGEPKKIEMLRYANCLQTTGSYDKSINWMQRYLAQYPDDHEVSKRIWQLQNVKFLFEDSIYYNVNPITVNTLNDEFAPVMHGNTLVFASNVTKVTAIDRKDASTDKPFYNWYFSSAVKDTINNDLIIDYSKKTLFAKGIKAKYHKGSISFYPGGDTMVFARTGYRHNNSKDHTTQLFFARKGGKRWIEYAEFPYNSQDYSVNHPSISEDGKTLYFVSDMPGGNGGTDIYSSNFVQGKWTEAKNMGGAINTKLNESHPFIQNNILYISSDGHPGLGGLDIFKINLSNRPFELQNFGFPINTRHDDFDLILNKNGAFGYLASNRNNEVNVNDDIFEVKINKLCFPLIVKGKIKYKKNSLIGSTSQMILLPDAKLELIDRSQKRVEFVTNTDAEGNFTLKIPYESQFLLRVIQKNLGVAVVSMEIPGNNMNFLNYEIVIIKELFNTL